VIRVEQPEETGDDARPRVPENIRPAWFDDDDPGPAAA
jgi:hypothetical protein